MSGASLATAAKRDGGRIIAALAARFRNLDIAEDAFAGACLRAAELWPGNGPPRDPAAWLYRAAFRRALDFLRHQRVEQRLLLPQPEIDRGPEDALLDDSRLIPEERLRLIFICCHPAVAAETRAALTLKLVCGLTTAEIARAFLVSEAALAQRLVRAKVKIAAAGVPFEVPGPAAWRERLEAVLVTLEVAYAKAHEDAAGASAHASYASEMLDITHVLCSLLPAEPEALALASLVRFSEARRPARLDEFGAMVPLSEQDPAQWRKPMIVEGQALLRRAVDGSTAGPRLLQALVHATWCARKNLDQPPPWPQVLALYDHLLACRDNVIVRLNRLVAVAEVRGPEEALVESLALPREGLENYLSWHALLADLYRRTGAGNQARAAYSAALSLDPAPAERLWLERRMAEVAISLVVRPE